MILHEKTREITIAKENVVNFKIALNFSKNYLWSEKVSDFHVLLYSDLPGTSPADSQDYVCLFSFGFPAVWILVPYLP